MKNNLKRDFLVYPLLCESFNPTGLAAIVRHRTRNLEIYQRYVCTPDTLIAIASDYGITHTRVRQIVLRIARCLRYHYIRKEALARTPPAT